MLICALSVCALWAQTRLTVDQLVKFVQSSIQLKHPDKQVASYLLKLKLSEHLDARTIEELQGMGVGPSTMEALRKLVEISASLPAPPPKRVNITPPPIPAPPLSEQEALIERVREYALNYSKNLPNFICTQVTNRFVDPTGLEFWQKDDQIVAQLTFFEQKEEYKVKLVGNRFVDTTMDRLGGTTSSGEFGSMMNEIFDRKTDTSFHWLRWATLGGKRAHVIAYDVMRNKGDMTISARSESGSVQTTKAGYTGLVYVERDSGVILRITQDAVDIEPGFPVQAAGRVLDYDLIDIAGNKFMLPLKFTTKLRASKFLTKNEVEFRNYSKYGTDTSIIFDTDDLKSDRPMLDREETPAK